MSLPAIATGNRIAAIIPTNFDECYRIAQAVSLSGLAPDGMKTAEQCMIAIMHGLEVGLSPMMAIQSIAVINGRPAIWGKAVPALLYRAGFKLEETDDGTTATCTVTRPDGQVITRTFSKQQAITAGLSSKSIWKLYPERMRQMRARGYACNDGAPDVLAGMYLVEQLQGGELRDEEAPQIAPPDEPQLPPEPEMPPDDEPQAFHGDPRAFVDNYRNDMVLMPPDERQDWFDANATSIEMLPKDMQDEIDEINRELVP
jgi:hypothetical protein